MKNLNKALFLGRKDELLYDSGKDSDFSKH